jgi:hypothetical protein
MRMRYHPIPVLLTAFMFASAISATSTTLEAAPPTIAQDAKRRVNMAGRQQMLLNRMARAACVAHADIDRAAQLEQSKLAQFAFDNVVTTLELGSIEQELLAEADPEVLKALRAVSDEWASFGAVVTDLRAELAKGPSQGQGSPGRDLLVRVLEWSVPFAAETVTTAILEIERKYDTSGILEPGLYSAINVSGRQRALAEKIGMEICMIGSGLSVAAARLQLTGTLALFRSSQEQLVHRYKGLKMPPEMTSALATLFDGIVGRWTALEPKIARFTGDATPTSAEVASLVSELAVVVDLYEKVVATFEATPDQAAR